MAIDETINERIFTPINGASAAMGLLLAVFIFTTQVMKLPSAKRLSFRLYLWIGLADVGTHLPLHLDFGFSFTQCQVTNLVVSYSNFVSLLIVSIMAMNLHLVFLLRRPAAVRSLRVYLAGVFLVALLLMLPSFIIGLKYDNACPFFTAFDFPISLGVLLATQGLPQLILIVYCLFVFSATTLQLRRTMRSFLVLRNARRSSVCTLREQSRMISRLALYPLMPLITIVPYFIAICLHPRLNMYSNPSQAIQWFSASTQGLLNFVFFLIDPSLPAVCREFRGRIMPQSLEKKVQPVKPSPASSSDQIRETASQNQILSPPSPVRIRGY
ncbi:hypothetical protein DSO57_1001033 [Entomophthora muscae]|uniref:Uncharacterized protein n=1 Tax=Entomophthora muscae TaxID=34485 RepID=A0ACC2UU48_9FUNG|nr:hypothetical protein DSO57_1001033 [Entomophthora muscae]